MAMHGCPERVSAGAGLYLHVPFCLSRCGYCSFYSVRREQALVDGYLDAMEAEMRAWEGVAPSTVYVGGGTPTALSPDELMRLLRGTSSMFDLSGVEEFTVEANPASVTPEMACCLADCGVTRVSMGAQSMEVRALAFAGRPHGVSTIAEAVGHLRDVGISEIGLDLIAGLPESDSALWSQSLRALAAEHPDHISVYALSIEAESKFARMVADGVFTPPAERAVLAMLDATEETLASLGYRQYEISNYARGEAVCRHNVAVWRGSDYLGLGPTASSRIGRWRWTNQPCMQEWGAEELEQVDVGVDVAERIMFGFRLNEGVPLRERCQAWGCPQEVVEAWELELVELAHEGVVVSERGRWVLTRRGRRLADSVAARLFACL